jgi:hypothetical protein
MVAGVVGVLLMARTRAGEWQEVESVADAVRLYPKRMRSLVDSLNLEHPGLEAVRRHWEKEDLTSACRALLAYYRTRQGAASEDSMGAKVRGSTHARADDGKLLERADDILKDVYYGYGEKGRVPRKRSGHLDWTFRGPKNDLQFSCRINRHRHLIWLLDAFQKTGEVKYARRIDQDLRDWLTASRGSANPKGFGPGRLEAALRMPTWCRVFFTLGKEKAFRPATRLLLLSSLPAHARYLRESLRPRHNFATMQMSGLGAIGLRFPEFKGASKWTAFAMKQMTAEVADQVYPDGVQKELTSSYHWVALRNFDALAGEAERAGRRLPAKYRKALERMYDYMAGSVRPDGSCPLNSDSDRADRYALLAAAASRFGRSDWTWIASGGKSGKRPPSPPSRFYPWAGQLISRSGWDRGAHWSFFDAGPYGISHQHNDKLHLSIHACGRDLLTDSGRFAYQGKLAKRFLRSYARLSRAHNVILVDGFGQQATEVEARAPHRTFRIAADHDFALGTYRRGFDPRPVTAERARRTRKPKVAVVHSRAVLYLRGRGWIVIDHLRGRGRHRIAPLWHFHPDCTVAVRGDAVETTDAGRGNLHVRPVGGLRWKVTLVKGQEKPAQQGWYSERYGSVQPATCAVYGSAMTGSATFGWVMTPGRDRPDPLALEWIKAPAGVAHLRTVEGRNIWVVMDPSRLPFKLPGGRQLKEHFLMDPEAE